MTIREAAQRVGKSESALRRDLVDALGRLDEKGKLLEENRQHQDTIILQLTRQLEEDQRLLEYHQAPWWRRWFRKREREG